MSVYLDHNASAPLHPIAAEAMRACLTAAPGNPSSVHRLGRQLRARISNARRQVAQALKVVPGELVFTSGATEALHLGIAGFVPPGGQVVTSTVEHPAVYGACAAIGAEVVRVPVDGQGRLDVAAMQAAVTPATDLVVCIGAQNEIGVRMPIARLAAGLSVPLLCDAVQLAGRVVFEPGTLGCAAAVISSHKIGGPHGCGALWVAPGHRLRPFLAGGPQERGRRAGTENVPGIVGFGAAATLIDDRLSHMPRLMVLRDTFETAICRIDGAVIHGQAADRLPNTSAFRFEGVDGDLLLAALDLEGYCLSSGSACSAGAVEPSSTLQALGLSPAQARGGLRLSLGPSSTRAQVESCAQILPQLVNRIRAQGACA